jgi:hypothetical protein
MVNHFGMKRKLLGVNSYDRKHDITPDEVRRFERFKNYNDEQVNELIDTIKKYTRFIYNVVSKRKKSGKKIALHIDNQITKAA